MPIKELRWAISVMLVIFSLALFVNDIVADAIWFGVMALLIRPKGDA